MGLLMLNSIHFKVKTDVDADKHRILEMFFKTWIDQVCNNQVVYKIEKPADNFPADAKIFKVYFANSEDAIAVKLSGIPDEFQHYLEMVV